MARLSSLFEKIRNWFLVLIGVLLGVHPAIASKKKTTPAIPERLAAVRSILRERQPDPARAAKKLENAEPSAAPQWGNYWRNWNNWNNWGNWVSWNNWGNWGNY